MKNRLWVCLFVAMLSGCGSWSPKEVFNIQGARHTPINDEASRTVDLVQLILDQSPNSSLDIDTCGDYKNSKSDVDVTRNCLEKAAQRFYADPVSQAQRRDRIQARLIASSNLACADFTQYLNTLQANGNLITGLLATMFSSAGAVVTDANSARVLAGLAAAATGGRAEFNSDLFFRQSVPVLTKAIRSSRQDFMRDVIVANRKLNIDQYPLWDSIGDAFRYNDLCSLVSGLSTLDTAVTLAETPGIDAVNRALVKVNLANKIAKEQITDLSSIPAATADFAGINDHVGLSLGGSSLAQLSMGLGLQSQVTTDLSGQYAATQKAFLTVQPSLRSDTTVAPELKEANAKLDGFVDTANGVLARCASPLAVTETNVNVKARALGAAADNGKSAALTDYTAAVLEQEKDALALKNYSVWLADTLAQAQRMVPGADMVDTTKLAAAYQSISDWLQTRQANTDIQPAFCAAAAPATAAAAAAAAPAPAAASAPTAAPAPAAVTPAPAAAPTPGAAT